MTDGQVFGMAVASFAKRLDVFQSGISRQNMLATHPAGHDAMHLAGHDFVDFVAGVGESAHASIGNDLRLFIATLR